MPARNKGLKSLLFPAWNPGGLWVLGDRLHLRPPTIQNKPIKGNGHEFKMHNKAISNHLWQQSLDIWKIWESFRLKCQQVSSLKGTAHRAFGAQGLGVAGGTKRHVYVPVPIWPFLQSEPPDWGVSWLRSACTS